MSVVCCIIGLVLGIGLLLLVDWWDNRLHYTDIRDLEVPPVPPPLTAKEKQQLAIKNKLKNFLDE